MIDQIKETDQEDYFINISHDKKVLKTFICRYADTLEAFDFSSYPGRRDLFAIRLKETGRLIGILSLFDERDLTYYVIRRTPDAILLNGPSSFHRK